VTAPMQRVVIATAAAVTLLSVACVGYWIWFRVGHTHSQSNGVLEQMRRIDAQTTPPERKLSPISQDRRLDEDGPTSFRYPFLGEVKCISKMETLTLPDGKTMPIKVFYDDKGRFLRAEYRKPGAPHNETTPEDLQGAWESQHEQILGFPTDSAKATWQEIVTKMAQDVLVADAMSFDVTFVNYVENGGPVLQSYIFCIYGVDTPTNMRVPLKREFNRTRYFFAPNGNLQQIDNLL